MSWAQAVETAVRGIEKGPWLKISAKHLRGKTVAWAVCLSPAGSFSHCHLFSQLMATFPGVGVQLKVYNLLSTLSGL